MFFALAFVYYLIILLILPVGKGALKALIPNRNPPTPIYGVLPKLEFVAKNIVNTSPIYKLDTKNGKLPTHIPEKMTVYRFKPENFSYQAGKNAKTAANFLGFTDLNLITDLKGNVYKWQNPVSRGLLEIAIDSRNLTLATPLLTASSKFPKGHLTEISVKTASNKLFNAISGLDKSSYQEGTQKIYYGKFSNENIVSTETAYDSQLARIDYFRSIGEYPIVTQEFTKGMLHAVVNPETIEKYYKYPMVDAYLKEIETQSNASYPIITVEDAWSYVNQNKGVVVDVTPKGASMFATHKTTNVDKIFIKNIYLAYYETPDEKKYLQPIYVFEGNYTSQGSNGGSIVIYYPAITGKYIQTSSI